MHLRKIREISARRWPDLIQMFRQARYGPNHPPSAFSGPGPAIRQPNEGAAGWLSLAEMPAGEDAAVVDFRDRRAVNNRLASLGFTPGVRIRMIQNFGFGPLIVSVRDTRVALGRGEAGRILVRQESRE